MSLNDPFQLGQHPVAGARYEGLFEDLVRSDSFVRLRNSFRIEWCDGILASWSAYATMAATMGDTF